MILALPLVPLLSTLALSGSVTIDDVAAEASNHSVTVAVTTSGAVTNGDVRAKLADGKLQLYLSGGQVRADRRFLSSGGLAIAVLKRTDYAKVEVPLTSALGCTGPITTEATGSGFRASITCQRPTEARAAEEPIIPTRVRHTRRAEHVVDQPTVSAPAAPAPAPPPLAVEPKAAEVKAAPPAPRPASMEPTKPTPVTGTAEPVRASTAAVTLPALALVMIGAVAVLLKRRQAKRSSLIQILETAPLGPRRQLVVARVNGETMILGSSEAGITCLTGMHRVPALLGEGTLSSFPAPGPSGPLPSSDAASGTAGQAFHTFDPPEGTRSMGNEFLDEGGLLTRLFRARGQERTQEKFENIELHEFDNLLQESVADQELRRKLSAGVRGKVS